MYLEYTLKVYFLDIQYKKRVTVPKNQRGFQLFLKMLRLGGSAAGLAAVAVAAVNKPQLVKVRKRPGSTPSIASFSLSLFIPSPAISDKNSKFPCYKPYEDRGRGGG